MPADTRILAAGLGVVALLYLGIHAAYLPTQPGDIDAINFVLGVQDFDPPAHHPHPPGYPIYIALGKLSSFVLAPEVRALAFWSALFGALSIFPLVQLFRAAGSWRVIEDPRGVVPAAILTLACPLLWFMSIRSLSDGPGLFFILLAQATLATALARQRRARAAKHRDSTITPDLASAGRLIVIGAFLAAVAVGIRAQAVWLTLPMLVFVIVDRIGEDFAGAAIGATVSFTLGVALWLVPTIVQSGGAMRYADAFFGVGGEHLDDLGILAAGYAPRPLALAVWRTLIDPWQVPALGLAVVIPAVVGLGRMALRQRDALLMMVLLFAPYGLFHLLFQDTAFVRYSLPLVPVVAYAAWQGLQLLTRRIAAPAALILSAIAIVFAHPVTAAFGSAPTPGVRLLSDLRSRATATTPVAMHHIFAQSFELMGPSVVRLPSSPRQEWLELVKYWRAGFGAPVWFLADPRRTDLALIDSAAQRRLAEYRWPFVNRTLLAGTRSSEADWIEINRPGWFAAEGFSLTPETAGVAHEMGRGPSIGPITAWVRRRAANATLMIGGRHLGTKAEGPVTFRASLDEREVLTWNVGPGEFFLRMEEIPGTAFQGAGDFAALRIAASAEGRSQTPRTSVEQFDVQDVGRVVFGFGPGWYKPEYDPQDGTRWRWISERAIVEVRHGNQPLVLEIVGESPLKYLDRPSRVSIQAGGQTIAEFDPADGFRWTVAIPQSALQGGRLSIAVVTNQTFVPAERARFGQTSDPRRLGLRIYSVSVKSQ